MAREDQGLLVVQSLQKHQLVLLVLFVPINKQLKSKREEEGKRERREEESEG